MRKGKLLETVNEKPDAKTSGLDEEKVVIGVVLADKLQKEGWILLDVHLTPQGKEYKFKKGAK